MVHLALAVHYCTVAANCCPHGETTEWVCGTTEFVGPMLAASVCVCDRVEKRLLLFHAGEALQRGGDQSVRWGHSGSDGAIGDSEAVLGLPHTSSPAWS